MSSTFRSELTRLADMMDRQQAGVLVTVDELGTHADHAVRSASLQVGEFVHAPALAPLSGVDRRFLAAMAIDDGPSRMGDVAERMGVDAVYAGQYRLRLLTAEIIHAPARGIVDFTLPYLRQYLRDQTGTDGPSPEGRAGPAEGTAMGRLAQSEWAERRHPPAGGPPRSPGPRR